ncbi:hypothetical protein [Planococcus beigongshangi]|uniref:hypothetical protein n=1 Tax=Planococcus beigongshangi TaxID=2782536 RepID=UPI00193AF38E|nr:hypothetical protein [Planococcus beigongshangi]
MRKVKIHSFILAALLFSSIAMAMYAYQNFSIDEVGYGTVFAILCLFFVGLVIFGVMKNRETAKEDS